MNKPNKILRFEMKKVSFQSEATGSYLNDSSKDSKILEISTKSKAEGFLMKLGGFVSLRSEIRQSVYRNEQVQQSLQFRKKPTLTKPNLL